MARRTADINGQAAEYQHAVSGRLSSVVGQLNVVRFAADSFGLCQSNGRRSNVANVTHPIRVVDMRRNIRVWRAKFFVVIKDSFSNAETLEKMHAVRDVYCRSVFQGYYRGALQGFEIDPAPTSKSFRFAPVRS